MLPLLSPGLFQRFILLFGVYSFIFLEISVMSILFQIEVLTFYTIFSGIFVFKLASLRCKNSLISSVQSIYSDRCVRLAMTPSQRCPLAHVDVLIRVWSGLHDGDVR